MSFGDGSHPEAGHDRPSRGGRVTLAVGVALVVAACSSGSPSPQVANLGHATTTVAGGGSSGSGSPIAQAEAYASCMRAHGIHDFPDPTSSPGGGVSFEHQAADQACKSLLPFGGQPRALTAEQLAQRVQYAACMRAHGVPNWPDPDAQGAFHLSGIDMQSPLVQAADKNCRSAAHIQGPIGVQSISHGSG
jgi:hypothetical protein